MKKSIFLLLIMFSTYLFGQAEKYGREINLTEKTKISEILAAPDSFLNKEVLVEGEILDVCAMAGCWMELKSDVDNQKIKIKVRDGDIVFPVEAKGKNAVVEGTVYKIDLTKDEADNYYKHLAEEQDTEFNPESVTGPVTIYQIKGLGAVIQ